MRDYFGIINGIVDEDEAMNAELRYAGQVESMFECRKAAEEAKYNAAHGIIAHTENRYFAVLNPKYDSDRSLSNSEGFKTLEEAKAFIAEHPQYFLR